MVNEDIWDTDKMLKEGGVIVLEDQSPQSTEEKEEKPKITNHIPLPITLPFEKGGWMCGGCERVLDHGDMLGFWDASNTSFTIVGYYCPKCEKRYLLPSYTKTEAKKMTKYRTMSGWERQFWRQATTT